MNREEDRRTETDVKVDSDKWSESLRLNLREVGKKNFIPKKIFGVNLFCLL